MEKDSLKEAEEEVLRVLKKDELKPKERRMYIPQPDVAPPGIPAASALMYPAAVGIASLAGALLARQLAAMAILPFIALGFFCTFLPGLSAGISDRFFRERTIDPMRLAGVLGIVMMFVAFFLIYTLPISSLPSTMQRELYPFGITTQSMFSLGMPAGVLGRAVNAGTAAALGFGILFGMAFSRILSRKVVGT